jgi:hypothetical protein
MAGGERVDHHDVPLPARWHLNMEKVSVPPAPKKGERLREEIRRRVNNFPQVVRFNMKYQSEDFWHDFHA